ncbi:hypothetical protein DOY81_013988 [Sarcophaga bullata]|nr:hypothetical protein DOY81_013988 [Sarcophaga bullata]
MLYHNVQRKADSDIPIVIFFILAIEQHPTITHDDSLKKVDCIMSVVLSEWCRVKILLFKNQQHSTWSY